MQKNFLLGFQIKLPVSDFETRFSCIRDLRDKYTSDTKRFNLLAGTSTFTDNSGERPDNDPQSLNYYAIPKE